MLSEGYLSGISYWFDDDNDGFSDGEAVDEMPREMGSICDFTRSSLEDTQREALFHNCKSVNKLISTIQGRETLSNRYQKSKLQQSTHKVCERQTSPVVNITGDSNINRETYIVPSSCKSMFRNYNDFYIAGDQVIPLHSGMTDFTSDSSFEFCDGPFLESSEIPPTMESMLAVSSDLVHKPVRKDSLSWRAGSIKDKSIIQHSLSNSGLNEYLEQKVVELYNQYIMDNMVNNASPTQIMTSEFIMNNVDQISLWISREQNMATTKAKDMVINCLRRLASEKMSTEISTPHLQISSETESQTAFKVE
uniref:Protein CXorf21 homolog n=1 Tax=Geotrypetes seraphini TaxID=260995 RepID=A0A6P8RA10_GEOSA|nr:protein CXorf21 homolog [Geotrypetes seraphini]